MKGNHNPTEAELVKHAVVGDRDAFGELYLMHLDAIYRYIYYRIGEKCEAEDLTEQVFLKAWQFMPEYRDCGLSMINWLYRIAHNVIVDFNRSQMKKSNCPEVDGLEFDVIEESYTPMRIDVEDTHALAQAISKLPFEQQQIILLRFIEGLGHSEISQILNKSEGACRMLQSRALMALSRFLKSVEVV